MKHSYCSEEVRRYDSDRFLTALFVSPERREDLFALYAFNLEISKTREVVSEVMLGAIRLQWWREAIEAIYTGGELRKHAVVEALCSAVHRHSLSRANFDRLIDGRMLDLESSPPATMKALVEYADATSGSLVLLAMEALGGAIDAKTTEAGRKVGVAWALTGLLRSMPSFLSRGRFVLPDELLETHGVERRQLLDLKPSSPLSAAIAEVAMYASKELREARVLRRCTPKTVRPALLQGVLAETYLGRIKRAHHNVFDPTISASAGLATARLAYNALIGRY